MNFVKPGAGNRTRILISAVVGAILLGSMTACSVLHGLTMERPAPSEFGFGPRISTNGLYSATLLAEEPLPVGRMQTVQVQVTDTKGQSVNNAVLTIDGGMPQHGHGLPTRPRVSRTLDGGIYEVDGVRFNMGGWWEFKLAINSPAGADTVTFNLSL